jgi:hypothetical protein
MHLFLNVLKFIALTRLTVIIELNRIESEIRVVNRDFDVTLVSVRLGCAARIMSIIVIKIIFIFNKKNIYGSIYLYEHVHGLLLSIEYLILSN